GDWGTDRMSTRVVSPETDGLDAQVTRLLRSLVQEGTDLLAVCAEDGTLLYVTPSLTRILGYDPDDVIGITSPEVMHPDDLPLVIEAFARARAERRADVEFRARHRDGSWRWLELVVTNLLDDPSVGGFVINGRDVTEGKRVEEELARLALYDSLTGLANRARLLDHLEQALAHVRRTGSLAAVLFLDLDHFKVLPDGLGP